MDILTRYPRRLACIAAVLAALPLTILSYALPVHAGSSGTTVIVHQQTLPVQFSAYGQVEPTSIVNVRTVEAGTLSELHVAPGSRVQAGEVLARLNGPQMRALLTERETSLQSAKAKLDAATHALTVARSHLALQLTTRQAVDSASSELAAARASAETAQTRLDEARNQQTIKAPTAGSVISVQSADGEQAQTGQTLLTIQPNGPLWVRAKYYGADASALRIGMTGQIELAGGNAVVPVKLVAIAPAAATDGGVQVGLAATSRTDWIAGQWGSVTLDGPSTAYVMVPTAALILDRGQWWVLVHTPKGDQPRRVVPGQAHGWQTGIVSGLRPGEEVVAQDAFLEYHRDIAQTYQPPD
ncbi:efflux RND transporter periplasmic adaptor subunit [Trinickia sp. NRRL B-1857]|uniref:efflux RND transporter periplasmic adaptor subunit n=1 Tax=Trinickia sp. NRRL B-1857 TaxID=3162879 RepID=UPI003D2C392A